MGDSVSGLGKGWGTLWRASEVPGGFCGPCPLPLASCLLRVGSRSGDTPVDGVTGRILLEGPPGVSPEGWVGRWVGWEWFLTLFSMDSGNGEI